MKEVGQHENTKREFKKRDLFSIALAVILILKMNVGLILNEKMLTGVAENIFLISISVVLAVFFLFEKRYGYFGVFLITLIISIIK